MQSFVWRLEGCEETVLKVIFITASWAVWRKVSFSASDGGEFKWHANELFVNEGTYKA
jgi:hypothetical protein